MRCLQCGYQLVGLVEDRCPECGTQFNPDDSRTYAPLVFTPRRALAIAASFAGSFVGWVLAIFGLFSHQVFLGGYKYTTDQAFWLFWTALVVGLWWLFFIAPLMCISGVLQRISGKLRACMGGCAIGVIGYAVIIGWFAGFMWITVAFAGTVGAMMGFTVETALTSKKARCAAPVSHRFMSAFYFFPLVSTALWLHLLWPAICLASPSLAYRYGNSSTRDKIKAHLIRELKVGDPADKVSWLLSPQMGPMPASGSTSGQSSGGLAYSIEWADNAILKAEVNESQVHVPKETN